MDKTQKQRTHRKNPIKTFYLGLNALWLWLSECARMPTHRTQTVRLSVYICFSSCFVFRVIQRSCIMGARNNQNAYIRNFRDARNLFSPSSRHACSDALSGGVGVILFVFLFAKRRTRTQSNAPIFLLLWCTAAHVGANKRV